MRYELAFTEKALKEFDKLSPVIAEQFLTKLEKVLENPHIPKNKLFGSKNKDLYKIKLRSAGFRLIYEVNDNRIVVTVISVGRRDTIYQNFI
ncbi:type II toxin-antitoxin system RelE family toxin [Ursidibacter arcticus]|uniref:type II toxin-antitoxin system RelE family toxin n=1 Tax=Ursidibacter arcticus TaxID=1524965 RepID=UPI0012FA4312|nr:type II toxin-antitoxin system RelE/ParE family toxin [Ursidibacter arcticus]KAE9536904.1 addiction module antitoxin [Ursidibacter arcticus]